MHTPQKRIYKTNYKFSVNLLQDCLFLVETLLGTFKSETYQDQAFYYFTCFYNDYELKKYNIFITSVQPKELFFQSNVKNTNEVQKELTKLNKHILFEDEIEQIEAQDGFVKNQIITKLKIKTYGLQ